MPKFNPSDSDCAWGMENLTPNLYPALKLIKGAFDRVDVPQELFKSWPQRDAVLAHFDELKLEFKRFACFISQPKQCPKVAHIDAFERGTAMVARFNIPIQGLSPVTLDWWDDGIDSDRIVEREFTELRNGVGRTAYSFKSLIDDWGTTPAFTVLDPGACWNRTEIAHRAQSPNCPVSRIQITAEVKRQIAWTNLVSRLEHLGYC
jgi:hypothetical protein